MSDQASQIVLRQLVDSHLGSEGKIVESYETDLKKLETKTDVFWMANRGLYTRILMMHLFDVSITMHEIYVKIRCDLFITPLVFVEIFAEQCKLLSSARFATRSLDDLQGKQGVASKMKI